MIVTYICNWDAGLGTVASKWSRSKLDRSNCSIDGVNRRNGSTQPNWSSITRDAGPIGAVGAL